MLFFLIINESQKSITGSRNKNLKKKVSDIDKSAY